MRYLNTVFSIVFLLVVITFCINNTQGFTLAFLGYRLVFPLQLWMLMVGFFVAGMVPIMALELPSQVAHFMRMRSMKGQIRQIEASICTLERSTKEPAE